MSEPQVSGRSSTVEQFYVTLTTVQLAKAWWPASHTTVETDSNSGEAEPYDMHKEVLSKYTTTVSEDKG